MDTIKSFMRQLETSIHQPSRVLDEFGLQIGKYIGQRNYSKFIVLARSRTGSNLLINALASNSAIHIKGEIFKYLKGRAADERIKKIYCRKPNRIKSAGFKIFYYHPLDDDTGRIWEILEQDNDVRVIHLCRRNLLRTVLSKRIAEETGVWGERNWQKTNTTNDKKKIVLDPKDMIDQFQKTHEWWSRFQKRFIKHPMYEVWYEDLVDNIDKVIEDISSFLSVNYVQPKLTIKKQNFATASELIENYNEIERILKGTKWEAFLREN